MPVYQAWNRTGWTDLIVLVTKCLVAAALIAHAHYVNTHTLDPTAVIQGSLRAEDQYAHSVPATLRVLLHTAWAAGGYVLASSLVGAVGRAFVWAPAYSLYYCTNVFGLGVALLACALPTAWAVARDGECLAVERVCLALDGSAGALCPYTIAGAATAAAAGPGILTSPAGAKSPEAHAFLLRRGLRALASTGANTSPCCYGPEFVTQCSEFLGAAYTQAVVACVLAALVMTQSAVSCFYLCCDCDRGTLRACGMNDWLVLLNVFDSDVEGGINVGGRPLIMFFCAARMNTVLKQIGTRPRGRPRCPKSRCRVCRLKESRQEGRVRQARVRPLLVAL